MADFAEKIENQEKNFGEISKVVTNFGKEPKRNLKKTERVLQWLDRINELQDEFKQRNAELAENDVELVVSKYFKDRLFETASSKVEKMKDKIEQILQNLSRPTMVKINEEVDVENVTTNEMNMDDLDNLDEKTNENDDSPVANDVPAADDLPANRSDLDSASEESVENFKTPMRLRTPAARKFEGQMRTPEFPGYV